MLCDRKLRDYFAKEIEWADAKTPIIYDRLFPNRVFNFELIVGAERKPYADYFLEIVAETDVLTTDWITEKTVKNDINVIIDNLGMMNEFLPVIDNSYNVIPICKNTQVVVLDLDKKTYCYQHLYIAKKNYLSKAKLELKQKIKYQKNLEKEKQKKEKQLEKLKKKQELQQEKQELKQTNKQQTNKQQTNKQQTNNKQTKTKENNENVIIYSKSNSTGCIQILKTGKNKGNQCGCLVTNDSLCKRHYNLINKNINITEK